MRSLAPKTVARSVRHQCRKGCFVAISSMLFAAHAKPAILSCSLFAGDNASLFDPAPLMFPCHLVATHQGQSITSIRFKQRVVFCESLHLNHQLPHIQITINEKSNPMFAHKLWKLTNSCGDQRHPECKIFIELPAIGSHKTVPWCIGQQRESRNNDVTLKIPEIVQE
jgi:hypothetical protein